MSRRKTRGWGEGSIHKRADGRYVGQLYVTESVTGARKRGLQHWLPHLGFGLFEIGLALFTKTEPPRTKAARAKRVGKLVATATLAKNGARRVANAVG